MDVVASLDTFGTRLEPVQKRGRPPLWRKGPHLLTSAHICSIEGLEEQLQACQNREDLQRVIDSVYEVPRVYRLSGYSDGQSWDMRVGPMILPMCNPLYTFELEVERRESDKALPKNPMRALSREDSPDEEPRHFVPGTFRLLTKFQSTRPTSSSFKDYFMRIVMTEPDFWYCNDSIHRFTRSVAHVINDKIAPSPPSTAKPTNRLHVNGELRCESLTEFELGHEHSSKEKHQTMMISKRVDAMLSLREMLLGPAYFDMCRYFSAKDLIHMSPSVFKKSFCAVLPRSTDLILATFLRQERLARRFTDGACIVRFLDERVSDRQVLDAVLPSQFSIQAGSSWSAHSARLERIEKHRKSIEEQAESLHSGTVIPPAVVGVHCAKKKRSTDKSPFKKNKRSHAEALGMMLDKHSAVGVIDDPNSKLAAANWFDTLRAVYYNVVGNLCLELGAFYSLPIAFSREERPYVQYLMDKNIIKLYIGFNPRGMSLVKRPQQRDSDGWGILVEKDVQADVHYTVHPAMQVRIILDTLREVSAKLVKGYADSLSAFVKVCSRNCRFVAGTQTLCYEEEFRSLSKAYEIGVKLNEGVLSDDLNAKLARLKILSKRRRSKLEPHERDFLDGHRWLQHQREILEDDLLKRDAVPASNTVFWEGIAELAIGNPKQFLYCSKEQQPFMSRFELCVERRMKPPAASCPPSEECIAGARKLMAQALCHPIVLFNMPETNVGERRKPHNSADLFCAAAREMADMCFGPAEVPYALLTTRDSLLFRRCDALTNRSAKLISLHELEKWTPGDLQEVLSACFYDWDGRESWRAPVDTHVLWIWADRNAIDMGALSVLLSNVHIPEEAMLDLRSICVQESECAGLLTTMRFKPQVLVEDDVEDVECPVPVINERLVLTNGDCERLDFVLYDEATKQVIRQGPAEAQKMSMDMLPSIRSGVGRPAIGWVELSSLSSWRQIYTLMCHVKHCLMLHGGTSSLRLLADASIDEFFFTDADPEAMGCDTFFLEGKRQRLVFKPEQPLDIYTDLNNPIQPDPPRTSCF